MPISEELLKTLICPLSKAPLILKDNKLISTDPATRKAYLIQDGIPVMLINEAETLSEEEWNQIMAENSPTKED